MVEAESNEVCEEYVDSVIEVIRAKGHVVSCLPTFYFSKAKRKDRTCENETNKRNEMFVALGIK